MNIIKLRLFGVTLSAFLLVSCETQTSLVSTEDASIAHIHIGHTLTAWPDTPNQNGLFETTEDLANESAGRMVALDQMIESEPNTFSTTLVVKEVREIALLVSAPTDSENYSVTSALRLSIDHINYAKESDDASRNVMEGGNLFEKYSVGVFKRAAIFDNIAENITSDQERSEIARSVNKLRIISVQILEGADIDNDGIIGSSANEYGLSQLRDHLAEMVANEYPAYRPYSKKVLFGILNIKSGTETFSGSGATGSYGRYSY